MAATLFRRGITSPLSNEAMLRSATFAWFASSSCDQPNQPRAARLCSGLITHVTCPSRRISALPAHEYHAMRGLSASGAWLLAEECPAKFLWRSPWNPLYQPEANSDFDLGVAAHLAVLEPARQADGIVLIEAGDYRTTKAREARDAARAAGLVPLLPWQFDIVRAVAGSIRDAP